MSSGVSSPDPMFIYKMPHKKRRALQNILDAGEHWKDLAAKLNWSSDKVSCLGRELFRPQGSPTDMLLLEWGTTLATVDMLVFYLLQLQLHRAAELFRGLVPDEMFTEYENNATAAVSSFNNETNDLNLPLPPIIRKDTGDTAHSSSTYEFSNHKINFGKVSSCHPALSMSSASESTAFDNFSLCSDELASSVSNPNAMSSNQHTVLPLESGDSRFELTYYDSIEEDSKNLPKPSGDFLHSPNSMIPPTVIKHEFSTIVDATGDFSSKHLLGCGTFGVVYLGVIAGNHLAIKKLHKDSCQDYVAEINFLCKFHHKKINALCGYSLDGQSVYFLSEYMVNGSFYDRLMCKGGSLALSWQLRQSILIDAASGLRYLHTVESKPVIHGDIKSSNILLGPHFEAKICDFGRVREAIGGGAGGPLLYTAQQQQPDLLDTIYAYLPSEFLTSSHHFTVASDVYSFGVVIYEACTGLKVFEKSRKNGELLTDYISGYGTADIEGLLKLKDSRAIAWPSAAWLKTMSLARSCTALSSLNRPTMSDVLTELVRLMKGTNSLLDPSQQSGVLLAECSSNWSSVAAGNDGLRKSPVHMPPAQAVHSLSQQQQLRGNSTSVVANKCASQYDRGGFDPITDDLDAQLAACCRMQLTAADADRGFGGTAAAEAALWEREEMDSYLQKRKKPVPSRLRCVLGDDEDNNDVL